MFWKLTLKFVFFNMYISIFENQSAQLEIVFEDLVFCIKLRILYLSVFFRIS